ncbi:MAG: hypothetical protein IJP31_05610 [Lachnospiraceae bacterium]|nr:hypothetical protein [Lachnospiraceae bacterium]
MKKIKHLLNEKRGYCLLILLLIFSVFQYSIERIYVFFLYPDEFGYWSAAATALGWDWKGISGLGSFYSFGYSLWLIPLLKLIPDSLTAYRGAIAVNMLLMCLSFFLLKRLAEKLLPGKEEKIQLFIAAVAVFYPAWIFYMQFTATEALLFFLFTLLTLLTLSFLEKPGVWTALGMALVSGYGFMVHMRFVGAAAACVLTIALWGLVQSGNRKKLLLLAAALVAVFLLAFFLKTIVRENVYSGTGEDVLKHNEFGGQLGKLAYIFTVRGAGQLLKNFSGKLLYMGTASMGLFYYGLFWCVQEGISLVRQLRKGKAVAAKTFLALFLFLALAAGLAISSVYSVQNKELDWIIYGRYSEFVLPVMLVAGLVWLYRQKKRLLSMALAWLCHTVVSMICFISFLDAPVQEIRGYMSVSLSWLMGEKTVDPILFLFQVWIWGSLILFLISFGIAVVRRKNNLVWILGLILAGEIFLGLEASHKYIYPVNEYMRYDLHMGELILADMQEEEVLYLDEGRTQWIDMLQMQLRERTIQVISGEELAERAREGTVLILHKDGGYREAAAGFYTHCKEYNVFCLYYN